LLDQSRRATASNDLSEAQSRHLKALPGQIRSRSSSGNSRLDQREIAHPAGKALVSRPRPRLTIPGLVVVMLLLLISEAIVILSILRLGR